MPNADLSFGVLTTELWSRAGSGLGLKAYRRLGRRGLVEFTGNVLVTARDWLTDTFASPSTHGLLAPWVLHTGLGPDAAVSGFMTQVIAVAVELGGMPVPKGGGVKLVEALAAHRPRRRRRARDGTGRRADPGRERPSHRCAHRSRHRRSPTGCVVANVTPTQLYGRLLADT